MSSFIHPSMYSGFHLTVLMCHWRTAVVDGDREYSFGNDFGRAKAREVGKTKGGLCFPLEVGSDQEDRHKWHTLCSGMRFGSFPECSKSVSWDCLFLIHTFKLFCSERRISQKLNSMTGTNECSWTRLIDSSGS